MHFSLYKTINHWHKNSVVYCIWSKNTPTSSVFVLQNGRWAPNLANQAHSGQARKGADIAYILHPM